MPYDLPDKANEEIGSLGSVVLPFAAPIVFWRNGESSLAEIAEINDARKFGGWGIQPDEIETMKESLPPELPAGWIATQFKGREGTYTNLITRRVYAAVIARRFAWFDKSVTQYLAYLGVRVENTVMPWGTVILQAKGLSGVDLDDAITKFKKLTAQFRDGAREQFFYAPLGTWGDTPEFVERKSKKGNGESHLVTPPRVYLPKNGYTKSLVDMLFVGRETAAEIVTLRKQSQEWLDDWNKKRGQAVVPQPEENPFGDVAGFEEAGLP